MFLPPFVIGPAHLSRCNVVVLPFFGPATDQDHKALAVLAKIDAVAGAEINPAFENALACAPGVGQVTPLDPREGAMVTLAAAMASSPSNHLAKRFLPVSSI
jgi:hypothetical protein